MCVKRLHMKQLKAIKTATSSRSFSILSSNSGWEMCSSGNRIRSVRPGGKYRSIRHTKFSEIQTAPSFSSEPRHRDVTVQMIPCVSCLNETDSSLKPFPIIYANESRSWLAEAICIRPRPRPSYPGTLCRRNLKTVKTITTVMLDLS